MIKLINYCKPDAINLIGTPHAFDDTIDGEIKSCPICGRIPSVMVRVDYDSFFACVSCFGGKGMSHAYIKVKRKGEYMGLVKEVVQKWNNGDIAIYRNDQGWIPFHEIN